MVATKTSTEATSLDLLESKGRFLFFSFVKVNIFQCFVGSVASPTGRESVDKFKLIIVEVYSVTSEKRIEVDWLRVQKGKLHIPVVP
jgi:hypothetical protein